MRRLLVFVVAVALMIGMWLWIGWYSLAVLALIVWMIWDPIGFSSKVERDHPASDHKWPDP